LLCQQIYDFDLSQFREKWDHLQGMLVNGQLEAETEKISEEICYCIEKRNWIRLTELFLYLDDVIKKVLKQECTAMQDWHGSIWQKNLSALKEKDEGLADLIQASEKRSGIEIHPGGTEGCKILIHDKEKTVQLFSADNPWLVSAEYFRYSQAKEYSDIYLWGFGGGFLTGWVQKKFPQASIHVYLYNLDIFYAVLYNICLDDILADSKTKFTYDPTALKFIQAVHNIDADEKYGIFMDSVEQQFFAPWAAALKQYIARCGDLNKKHLERTVSVGQNIFRTIGE